MISVQEKHLALLRDVLDYNAVSENFRKIIDSSCEVISTPAR